MVEQQGTTAQLQGQVKELQARFGEPAKTSANSSIPPAQGRKANRKGGQTAPKRGPSVGHAGRGREWQEPDEVWVSDLFSAQLKNPAPQQ